VLMHSVRRNTQHARTYLVAAILGAAALAYPHHIASSQSDDMVAFEDSQPQAPDAFNAAEEALMQGLHQRNVQPKPAVQHNAVQHNFPSAAQIREIAAVKEPRQEPNVRRIKSQDAPNILDTIPVLEPETFDTEAAPDLPVQAVAPAKQVAAAQLQKKATETKPAASAAKKAAAVDAKQSILQQKLTASEVRARDLERQLREAKSQLAAAELEITRLSSIVQNNSRARLNLPQAALAAPEVKTQPAPAAVKPATSSPARVIPEKVSENTSDLHVATIAVEKADLRLGPGKNHSALMTLRRGSRLAIEARQGEWYRVFAPNGQRAWIHSSLVRFGDGAANLNDGSSVRMRGFDESLR
jgi:hypothetical protein